MEVELLDQTAPAEWFFDDKPITPSNRYLNIYIISTNSYNQLISNECFFRIEIKNLGGGKHQLNFNKIELKDAGAIMCKSNELTSLCLLEVKKGEEKPVIAFDENVEGPVSRPISFEVPYKGMQLISY